MRIRYPGGGPHVLLLNHSYYEHGHGILARTWDQVTKIFNSDKYRERYVESGYKVERALELEIVQPSLEMQHIYQRASVERDLSLLKWSLMYAVDQVYAEGGIPLPRGFAFCPEYQRASLWEGEEHTEVVSLMIKEHKNCRRCTDGLRIRRTRLLELYAAYLGGRKTDWHRPSDPPRFPESRAARADPERDLYALVDISGMEIVRITQTGARKMPDLTQHDVLAYFHINAERAEKVSFYQQSLREAEGEDEESLFKKREQEQERRRQAEEEKARMRQDLMAFLGDE